MPKGGPAGETVAMASPRATEVARLASTHTTYQRNGSAKIIDGHRISSILLTVDLQRGLELNVGVNKFFEGQDGLNTQYWQNYSMYNIIKYPGGMKYLPITASVDRKSVLHISTAMPTFPRLHDVRDHLCTWSAPINGDSVPQLGVVQQ